MAMQKSQFNAAVAFNIKNAFKLYSKEEDLQGIDKRLCVCILAAAIYATVPTNRSRDLYRPVQ
jgi:thermostable 8-oxoguanine DNA glycosylase